MENKTKRLVTGVISSIVTVSMVGCSSAAEQPPIPDDVQCNDWEWDDELSVWECDDYDSDYYGHYYHGGTYYKGKNKLTNSSSYKSYKSGFGSGSRGGFGG